MNEVVAGVEVSAIELSCIRSNAWPAKGSVGVWDALEATGIAGDPGIFEV
jgi:hypothetical protein